MLDFCFVSSSVDGKDIYDHSRPDTDRLQPSSLRSDQCQVMVYLENTFKKSIKLWPKLDVSIKEKKCGFCPGVRSVQSATRSL